MNPEDIDLSLSKKVANEASMQINEIKHKLEDNKDGYIMFLKDMFNDARDQRNFRDRIIQWCFVVILLLVIGMLVQALCNQRAMLTAVEQSNSRIMEFLESSEFYTEVELLTDNESQNSGSIYMNN